MHLSNALFASDFDHGTVRLTTPGVYTLQEDVNFDPNTENDSWPNCADPAQADYCDAGVPSGAYVLGFFAAITMEGAHIHLDLNGFTLAQSQRHALNQRFFAVVEMADQPFVPKPNGISSQGPGNFGGSIDSCTGCSIRNGNLGRSAHHGIHGNRVADLLISDVVFQDYEVAAISLNGCQRCMLTNLDLRGSFTAIPTRATFSAARFGLLTWGKVERFLQQQSQSVDWMSSEGFLSVNAAATALQDLVSNFTSAHVDGTICSEEALEEFGMPTAPNGQQLVDGNAYGITLHGDGVLVGPFGQGPLFCAARECIFLLLASIASVISTD